MMPEFKRIGQVTNAVRIEISPAAAPYRWDEYWGWSGVNELWIGQFASSVMGCCDTNPSDWFVSPFAVPASAWRVIELWDDQQLRWVPIQASADRMVQEMVPLAEEVLNG